jgi:GTPase
MPLTNDEIKLVDKMLKGDRVALGRLMTLAESRHHSLPGILGRINSSAYDSYVIGITGPPGAGKSTITDKLITQYRAQGERVGVIAVDPSSPFSGGSILGDRVRMHEHAMDDGVFIRSLSSRGLSGGLARSVSEMIKLYGAFAMDYVIVETVGVGQTELQIMDIADTVVVVLVPEAGDSVQTMKAGLMEIADVFVVNKADRDGAKVLASEIKSIISIKSYKDLWEPPVLLTSAHVNEGIAELKNQVEAHKDYLHSTERFKKIREKRKEDEFSLIVKENIERELSKKLESEDVKKIYGLVRSGEIDPYEGARRVIEKIL